MNGKSARTRLILQMERIIAKQCHQQNLMGGKKYRYPVQYRKNGVLYKTTGNGVANVKDPEVRSMQYKFGSHTMDIGIALDEILDFIYENCHFDATGMTYCDKETEEADFDPNDLGFYDAFYKDY